MSWIDVISPDDAEGRLAKLYGQVVGPNGEVDRILQVHSLRPHSLVGHLALYKNVLHHARNELGRATLELLGVYVSELNGCEYCVEHHAAGLAGLLKDASEIGAIRAALSSAVRGRAQGWERFSSTEVALLNYARKLTLQPAAMVEADLAEMRAAGVSDGQILEANQVISYFQYANRTVLGLGVTHHGETLGLAPSAQDDENDWSHR